jgi:hypothetical protein
MSIPILDEDPEGELGVGYSAVDVGIGCNLNRRAHPLLGDAWQAVHSSWVGRRGPHDLFAVDRSTGTRIESSLWSSVHQRGGGLEGPNLDPRA